MTLRTSYFKWMKEDWKRRRWTIVVFGILCFILTVSFEMSIEAFEQGTDGGSFLITNSIEGIIRYNKIYFYLMCSGIGALLFGFQGFSWLMNRKQVDFYHSQPMKREKRFTLLFLDGIFLYEICMILHTIILGILVGTRGLLTTGIAKYMLINLCVYTAVFLVIYSIVILAVMLTGNMVVAFMASGTLLFYISAVKGVVKSFCSMYFQTYTDGYGSGIDFFDAVDPFQTVIGIGNGLLEAFYGTATAKIYVEDILQAVLFSAVVTVLAYFLYKKRASECAGKALAFPWIGNIIRILVVIPFAMVLGLCLTAFQGGDADGWLYFGTVLGTLLMHGFMEVVFQSDIRACLGKKKQLLVSLLLSVGIVSAFRYDLFGYDRFLPKEEQVKEVAYSFDMTEFVEEFEEYNYGVYYKLDEDGTPLFVKQGMGAVDWSYSETDYHLLKTATEECGPLLRLIKAHIENKETDYSAEKSLLVRYQLKSGKEVYRQYYLDAEKLKESFAELYEVQQTKESLYPYLHLAVEKAEYVVAKTHDVSWDNEETEDMEYLEIKEEDRKELLACYQKDIQENTFEEFCNGKIVGAVSFDYRVKNSKAVAEISWVIADTYENTLAFLKEKGLELK